MNKIIQFNICATILGLVLLSIVLFQRATKGRANRVFVFLLLEVILTTVFDIFAVSYDNAGIGNVTYKWIYHGGYLFFHTLTAPVYLIYIISLADTWHKVIKKKITVLLTCLPFLVFTVCILSSYWTHWIYYINDQDVYTRGNLFLLNYVVAAFYMIGGIVYISRYRKLFNLKWFVTLFAPYAMIIIAMVVEYFDPQLVIEMFFNMLGLFAVSYIIQRNEETLDHTTGMGSAERFETICKRILYNSKPTYIVYVIIVNYSSLEDMLSFDRGEKLLRRIASEINAIDRGMGMKSIANYLTKGRFALVVDRNKENDIDEFADRIRRALNDNMTVDGDIVPVSTSISIVRTPDDISTVDALRGYTDKFESKLQANKVLRSAELFRIDNNRMILNIDRIIERAIKENEFEVYYQPIYSTKRKKITACEALLRLKDSEYGFVPAGIFIPAAEKNGYIHRLGDLVLEQVCEFIAGGEFETLGLDYVDVNMSVIQCMRDDVVEHVMEILKSHKVDPKRINFEITETSFASSSQQLENTIGGLNKKGIRTTIDEFGKGYSNLSRLMKLPISIVKIDKGFAEIEASERNTEMVKNLVAMFKALHVKTLIDGVESVPMVDVYAEMGVDFVQGYCLCRPIPKQEFITYVKEESGI